ncbi:unnamed protein product [Bursaphelenchus xylophilus]|uniref:(pine wood nematode) hypothetical protein n=1 Tax=Bursaphelenchus xylophilus TaxID=6326 RepID=A0A1I7SFJ9_BURXY|nr:unnamed protein product [Bursaphelenchus xylophilus]CAG9111787.1 unnamed protein product [Bursaphelenchus xylophilus]
MPLRARRASPGTVAVHRNGFQVLTVNVRSIRNEGKLKEFKKSLETEVISMNSTSPYTRPFWRFSMRWIDDAGKNQAFDGAILP